MKNMILLFVLLLASFSCKKERNCTEGFTGDGCNEEIPPESYLIKSVSVTGWPLLDNAGVAWDFGSNVDLYVKIYKGLTVVYTSPVYEEAQTGLTQGWTTSIEFLADDILYVEIWDDDAGFSEDDYIGFCVGPYWEPGQGFPVAKTVSEGAISVLFEVDYRF